MAMPKLEFGYRTFGKPTMLERIEAAARKHFDADTYSVHAEYLYLSEHYRVRISDRKTPLTWGQVIDADQLERWNDLELLKYLDEFMRQLAMKVSLEFLVKAAGEE